MRRSIANRFQVTDPRKEKLETIKKWIKDDPQFSKLVQRMVREIRREQRGVSMLSPEDKLDFKDQLC